MPGHQQGYGMADSFRDLLGKSVLAMDLTEVPGLDNLKNPQGCLKESQDLAAQVFGACQTFYLVNGSTIGLQAALLAANKAGQKILLPRYAHLSVVNGLALSGGVPVLAPVSIDPVWGIPLGTKAEEMISLLGENPDIGTALITQPTYHGIGVDSFFLIKGIQEYSVTVIADEAHGAHLYFQTKIPLSAQRAKADLVIQSTHKTLGSLTQSSMLHVNGDKWRRPVRRALDILQTTSPSYLLLASLDSVQDEMAKNGGQVLEKTWELAEILKKKIRDIPGYRLFGDELAKPWIQDPARLVISAAELGLTGWELADILRRNYSLGVELSDYYYILILVTLGHNRQDISRLMGALLDIRKYEKRAPLRPLNFTLELYRDEPKFALTPRQVLENGSEEVPLDQALGRIAFEPLTVYPPGTPFIWPGQALGKEHLTYLEWALKQHFAVHGISKKGSLNLVHEN